MTVYTVHEPPPRKRQTGPDPERIVFVRDGFHFWAFLLGPLWMLWHGMWLVLLIYIVAMSALFAGLTALGVAAGANFVVGFLVALLIGMEAGSLKRFTLRRWQHRGLVVASDRDGAERRFFDAWTVAPEMPPPAPSAPPPAAVPTPSSEVIGLFPEPQPRS